MPAQPNSPLSPSGISRLTEEAKAIRSLARRSDRIKNAHERTLALFQEINASDLEEIGPAISDLLAEFLPKRRQELSAAWDIRSTELRARKTENSVSPTGAVDGKPTPYQVPPHPPSPDIGDARAFSHDLRQQLQEISDRYLYQWEGYYRPLVDDLFGDVGRFTREPGPAAEVLRGLRREFGAHVVEIVEKGFQFNISQKQLSLEFAIQKNQRGLRRLLQVIADSYVARVEMPAHRYVLSEARVVCSAIVCGVLRGYARVSFDTFVGAAYMAEHPEDWVEYVALLTSEDLARVVAKLPASDLHRSLNDVVSPLARAVDNLVSHDDSHIGPPIIGQFTESERRLELSFPVRKDSKYERGGPTVQAHCYLAPSFADVRRLEELAYRGVGVILASLTEEAVDSVMQDSLLRSVVVSTRNIELAVERAATALHRAVAQRLGRRANTALRYNYAKLFPIHDPSLGYHYRVSRPSVLRLLGNIERRNGVHLWCSIRRSGKTTACFDLESTTGISVVIPQTCANTNEYPGSYLFFTRFEEALESGRSLPRTFIQDAVQECSPTAVPRGRNIVFLLDEYEVLFGRILGAVRQDPDLRYSVVQPLFHQLMGFARDNLLIMVGQRPDAYNVLSDLNQLSPYVQQDHFPLFTHGTGAGGNEFRDLLARILPDPFVLEPSFEDAVFEETGGHPYLTANVLVSFVDWLIEQERSTAELTLYREDFEVFTSYGLSPTRITVDPNLTWFRGVVSEALGDYGRVQDPWLHSVYWTLRQIARSNPINFTCSRSELEGIHGFGTEQIPFQADYILETATRANFLELVGNLVRPRIRLLGRLAAAAYPRTQ